MKNSQLIITFIIFIFLYFISYTYSSLAPLNSNRSDQYFVTIFGLFLENKNPQELFIFFMWPFLSFLPLLIYYFIFIKNSVTKFKINTNINYYIIFFALLIIVQPIMQGLDVSGKNIIRLSTLAFPAILFYLLINSKSHNFSKIKLLLFPLLILVWNSHPTFSVFNFLEKFKF